MKTKYTFGGQLYRYQIFISFLFLILVYICVHLFESNIEIEGMIFLATFIILTYIGAWISLWLHPMISIKENGIGVSRLGFIKRIVTWNNIKLFKKIRTITRYGTIGLDPRYAIIQIKDGTFFDKRITILPFFKDYDKFIREIEKHLLPNDITTDKNYH